MTMKTMTWGNVNSYTTASKAMTSLVWNVRDTSTTYGYDDDVFIREVIPKNLPAGKRTIGLPDGSSLHIDDAGNYRIDDADAKVKYLANRNREFSPHLNASDMLADFVRYVGGLGVRREDVMNLPIHLFVAWLIIEAAERDGDAIPDDVQPVAHNPVVELARRPRCLECGRFIKRIHHRHRFLFCEPSHAAAYLEHSSGDLSHVG